MTTPYSDGIEEITRSEHISPTKTGDAVAAKKVVNYETFDGVNWTRQGTQLATRIDDSASPITYIGKAAVGAATSSAVWQIAKVDTTAGMIKTWADSAAFTQIWDDRASLTYN